MAVKVCETCGGKVSTSALQCPYCGDNQEARRNWWWALAVVLVMGAVMLFAQRPSDQPIDPLVVENARPRPSYDPVPSHGAEPFYSVIGADEVPTVPAEYRVDVPSMLALLYRKRQACRRMLATHKVLLSKAQDDPANPSFEVECVTDTKEVVRFTLDDAVNKRLPPP